MRIQKGAIQHQTTKFLADLRVVYLVSLFHMSWTAFHTPLFRCHTVRYFPFWTAVWGCLVLCLGLVGRYEAIYGGDGENWIPCGLQWRNAPSYQRR
jgi:hypothetical protein